MVRLLLVLALLPAIAWGACAPMGKLCKLASEASNEPECCEPPAVPDPLGCVNHHCIVTSIPPSTTEPDPPGSTTTTRPPSPTTTVPSTTGNVTPLRFTANDVGLRFPDSQEVLWDPRTGMPANDYDSLVRVVTSLFTVYPEVLRGMRDTPGCSVSPGTAQSVSKTIGELFILYTLRPMQAGGLYDFHSNYVWDQPQALYSRGCACARGKMPPGLCATLPKPPPHIQLSDRSHMEDGQLNTRHVFRPLTAGQCALLHTAHEKHEIHAQHLLDHDPAAVSFGPPVIASQLAFEGSARDPFEQTLFTLIFTGMIDGHWSQGEIDAFTHETSFRHALWMDCMHCQDGKPPDLFCAWREALAHGRAHFLRAIKLKGLAIREVCPLPTYVGNCPITDF